MSSKTSSRFKTKRRFNDPWVSNNRVLNGGLTKRGASVARNPNFDTDETKLLIQLWGDPQIQRTLITTHKKHAVICQLAVKMQDYGYFRSAEEITTRIKNLKCFYNRLKKEMELSKNSGVEPSWKHFAEMDAIMTRPIFSVRPNEVPAPSLKYQMEKKKEERAERKRKALEEGSTLSESDDESDDLIALSNLANKNHSKDKHDNDDGIIPDVEIDIDDADEAFVALANAAEKSISKATKKSKLFKSQSEKSIHYAEAEEFLDEDIDENRLQIKEELETEINDITANDETIKIQDAEKKNKSNSDKDSGKDNKSIHNEDTNDSCVALVIPKDEPIDVSDADDDESFVKKLTVEKAKAMPILGNILKLQQNNLVSISSAGNILIPISSLTTTNAVNTAAKISSEVSNTTTTTSTITTAQQLQQGKISLVPTNFLMQPKTISTTSPSVNIGMSASQPLHTIKSTIPSRILLHNSAQSKSTVTSQSAGIVTGTSGMKVLLVNADQTAGKLQLPSTLTQQISSTNLGITNAAVGTVLPLNSNANTLFKQQASQQQQQHQQQQQIHVQKPQQEQNSCKNNQQPQQQKDGQHAIKKKRLELDILEKREDIQSKREVTGMRILIRQLLNVQTENNEIQKQRLALERERLEFEKNVAERFLTSLPNLFTPQQQQSQPTQQFVIQQPKPSTQHYQQNISTPTQLRLNPPKLVFATGALTTPTIATSSSTITSVVSNAANILTASFPKVTSAVVKGVQKSPSMEVCTPITSDMQLLTPKVESDD